MNHGRTAFAYAYILPAVLFMVVFVGYPIVNNVLLSFQDVNVLTFSLPDHPWVGWATYDTLLQDPLLLTAVSNTFVFTLVSLVVQFTLGFLLALLFSRPFPHAATIRGLLVVAWMLPVTVTALIFKYMLSPSDGILNYALVALGLVHEPVGWLINPATALGGVILANVWVGTPFNMILLATALSTVPVQLYESAKVDGASAVRTFFVITLPSVKSAILSVLVLGFIYTFRVFELIYVMTNGGPVDSTEVLSTVSYQKSFVEFNFSSGAAAANVLFLVLFAVSLVYLRWTKNEEKA